MKRIICVETREIFDSANKAAMSAGVSKSRMSQIIHGKSIHEGKHYIIHTGIIPEDLKPHTNNHSAEMEESFQTVMNTINTECEKLGISRRELCLFLKSEWTKRQIINLPKQYSDAVFDECFQKWYNRESPASEMTKILITRNGKESNPNVLIKLFEQECDKRGLPHPNRHFTQRNGNNLGRPKDDSLSEQWKRAYDLWTKKEMTTDQVSKSMNCSRSWVYKRFAKFRKGEKKS